MSRSPKGHRPRSRPKAPGGRGNAAKAKPSDARKPADQRRGLASRRLAIGIVEAVLQRQQSLDDALAHAFTQDAASALEPRDRAFARLLSATILRRRGQLGDLVSSYLERPLPDEASRVQTILEAGAAQLHFLNAPPHAVIDTAVSLCGSNKRTFRFRGLVNAVLRRIAENGSAAIAKQDAVSLNVPDWLLASWQRTYGDTIAHQIGTASLDEPALDITPKADPETWAQELSGTLLPTGTIRCSRTEGRIEDKPGYAEGAWWVQDFSAALPVRLFGPLGGQSIADLCAAPGGKTAQLAAGGAKVVAVDISEHRLKRLTGNLKRLQLDAHSVAADVLDWRPDGPLDGVLLDVPCSATGTIRRHPDILHRRTAEQVSTLTSLQAKMLAHACDILPAGAVLVYCTCSLQAEEGPEQISRLLGSRTDMARAPVTSDEIDGLGHLLTADGDVRTLPFHLAGAEESQQGMDGFYICRLRKLD